MARDEDIDLAEYRRIVDGLETDIKVINESMIGLDKIGVHSASQFIRTESTPTFMNTAETTLWSKYQTDIRDFLVKHYQPGISTEEIIKAFGGQEGAPDIYDKLMRKMVLASELEYTLKTRGYIDVDSGDEHTRACIEVHDMGGCLADMIGTLHDYIEFNAPGTQLKDFKTVVEEMATEAWQAEREKQRNKPVINQMIDGAKQSLCQKLTLGLSTDFTHGIKGHAGPFSADLYNFSPEQESGIIAIGNAWLKEINGQHDQQVAQNSSTPIVKKEKEETQQSTDPRRDLIRNAARLLAQQKLNHQQEHATLAKAYEPIESLLVLADNDTPFAQKEVLCDLVQTMAHTYDAGNSASRLGDTEKAADFKGLTESLGQFYSVLLGAYGNVKPYLPEEARAAIGLAKGAAKNVVGVAHAICNPKETMQALEVALNKLDYHAGRLYRGNPEEWAQVHAAIKAFSNMSDGDRAEFLGELAGSILGGPALLTKGVSAGAKLLQETRLLEKTNVLIQKYGVKALEITKVVATDDKFAVTPEGVKVPVQMAAEGEVGAVGNKVKPGHVEETQQVTPAVKVEDVSSIDKIAPEGPYSGHLVKSKKPDAGADALAAKLNGQSRMAFSNDPILKEFDVISDEFIAETKPDLNSIGQPFRKQAKRAFEAAKQTGRKVYFHFNGEPCRDILKKLHEYQKRYGVEMIIDTEILY